jgi:hypothetical protein
MQSITVPILVLVMAGLCVKYYCCFLVKYPSSGVDLIKLFWRKFTYSMGKLDLFIAMQQILLSV